MKKLMKQRIWKTWVCQRVLVLVPFQLMSIRICWISTMIEQCDNKKIICTLNYSNYHSNWLFLIWNLAMHISKCFEMNQLPPNVFEHVDIFMSNWCITILNFKPNLNLTQLSVLKQNLQFQLIIYLWLQNNIKINIKKFATEYLNKLYITASLFFVQEKNNTKT